MAYRLSSLRRYRRPRLDDEIAHLDDQSGAAPAQHVMTRSKLTVRHKVAAAAGWAAGALAAAIVIVVAGHWAEQREQRLQVDALRHAVQVHALGLQGAAEKFDYLPFTVAQQPLVLALLGRPDDASLIDATNRYLEDVSRRAGTATLYVMNAEGLTVAASNWRTADSFVGHSYRHRPYFQDARAGASGFFYGVGVTTSVPGLFIAAPIVDRSDVVGVVVVKVGLELLQTTFSQSPNPVAVFDKRGIAFLSSVVDWIYRASAPLSREDLEWIREHQQYGSHTLFEPLPWKTVRSPGQPEYLVSTPVDGKPMTYVALDASLPSLGWTLTVMSDHGAVVDARNEAMALAALAVGVLLLAALYWQLHERHLVEQRRARIELEQEVRERTRELQEAHAFRKAMEDSLLVGMRARDLEGRIIYVNPALCEMTGYSAEELLGRKPPYPYWHPDHLEKHWHDNNRALSGHAALTGFESRIRHRDGRDVVTMVYTAPLIDSIGRHTGWMSSVVDVTAQRQAAERQRQQEAQLQRTARLVSLGEMASTLAHELNQPLMALTNFATAARALARNGHSALILECLDDIEGQAQRAADIVLRIRGFVRRHSAGFEACDPAQIVAAVSSLMEPELRHRRTTLQVDVEGGLSVRGDRVLLELVLSNLMLNGLQAMADTPPDRRLLKVIVRRRGDAIRFDVEDCGSGVSEKDACHLFEMMFTTKADGLGLGLSIRHTIVEGHGGRIGFENRTPCGAIFFFTLPAQT
jgi:PAS domain S-box-containing protein